MAIGGSSALLSVHEAAEFLSIPERTLRENRARWGIPAYPVGRTAETEWGVAHERGGVYDVTLCASEEAAHELQAASGGEIVCRKTYSGTWD